MSFNLADLIDIEKTQQLLENFLSAVGVPAAIIDLEGTVLVSSSWQRVCTDFHRRNEITCRRCIESDTILANDLSEGKTFSLYRCLNGLTDAASPITIEGKHLANAFIGQFFIEKPDLEFFRAQAKEFGFDQSAYLDALSEVPIVAEETLPSILAFLTSFAVMTAGLGLRQLRQLETEKELREARERLETQNRKLLASEQDLHHSRDELETRVQERTVELIETNRRLEAEVRNRQKVEEIVRARNQMLHAMAGAGSRQEYLEIVVGQIQEWSACRCVGIRLLNESGAIPYASYTGFNKEFWESENEIILGKDSCVCTRVVTGKPEAPDIPCMTASGSFRCEDTASFAASLTHSELSRYRGVCISSGFQSLAVIPIRCGAVISGAIHLADTRPSMIPDRLVELLEDSTFLIGEAIYKFQIRDRFRRSQQLLEKTFESLDDSVLVIDLKDRTVLACNPALTRDFGYPQEYVTGRNTEFLHVDRDAYEEFGRRMIAALDKEGVFRTEFRMRRKDGSIFPTEHRVTDLVEDSGDRTTVVGTIRDITSRKRAGAALVESERKFHAIFESALDTIIIADSHGRFKDVNPVASSLFGLEREELIGRSIREFSASDFNFDRAWGVFLKKGIARGELRLSRTDGTVRDVEYCAVSEFYPEHHLAVLRDITGRKLAEAELKSYAARLEQSNQALQEFASIASHDMKEPLRKVLAFGNLLRQKHRDSLGQTGGDYLNRMLNATQRMQALLTSLFEYSKVTMNPEPFREIDLNGIIRDVLSDLEIRIKKVGGKVQVGKLPVVAADPAQMRQLFQNLIANALKFRTPAEKPMVQVRSVSGTDTGCQIVVEDNGIGFEERFLDRIFAPFQRLHGRSSQYEGTGMGLAICKKIVERHGGSITARSTPGYGATFIITLPLSKPD
jgi:two-component system sensor kinase FixL